MTYCSVAGGYVLDFPPSTGSLANSGWWQESRKRHMKYCSYNCDCNDISVNWLSNDSEEKCQLLMSSPDLLTGQVKIRIRKLEWTWKTVIRYTTNNKWHYVVFYFSLHNNPNPFCVLPCLNSLKKDWAQRGTEKSTGLSRLVSIKPDTPSRQEVSK